MDNKEDENLGSFYMGRTHTPPSPRRQLPTGLLTALALFVLAGIIWYAYPRGAEKYADMDVPVVKADTAPIKEQPTEPGGMEVPHQDSTVFEPLEKKSADQIENINPMPEEPMDKGQAIKAVGVETPSSKMAPKLNLDLQMKDTGNGVEKVVPEAVEVKPAVVAPPKNEVKTAAPAKVEPAKAEPLKAAGQPALAVSGGTFKVQLGAYRDLPSAQKDWDKKKKVYPLFLSTLNMDTTKVYLSGKGIYYRLRAGNVTEARAKEICGGINAVSPGGCILVKY